MSDIAEVVKVTITRGTKTITRAGFGIPLILSSDATFSGVRTYTSITALEADFASSTAVWKAAARLFGQDRKPSKIKVAKRLATVAQVDTVTILNNTVAPFTITIGSDAYTFTPTVETIAQIRTALKALINADVTKHGVTAGDGGASEITLTGTAGWGFTATATANMTNVHTTANVGVVGDLQAAQASDDDFYAVILTSRAKGDILSLAEAIETRRKIFLACTADAAVKSNSTNNVAAILKGKSYARTALMYSGDNASMPEAAWAGACLTLDSGSETWKFKSLTGITTDVLTDTEVAALKLNNVNMYRTFAGLGMTSEGQVAVGEFIDVIRFVDWLQAQIEEQTFILLNSNPKIPFTDNGVAMVYNVINQQLQRGINVGGLKADPAPEIFAPKVADILSADRAARLLPDVTFNAQLAGAIHFTEIDGVVVV